MTQFAKGNKSARHRHSGTLIVKCKGKPGYYLRWYESRQDVRKHTIVAEPRHRLTLQPSAKGGLTVVSVHRDSPHASVLQPNDLIISVAGIRVKTVAAFTDTLTSFAGKQVLLVVNKGGKTGTTPRFAKAGATKEMAQDALTKWKEVKQRKQDGLPQAGVTFSELVDQFLALARTPAAGYSPSWLKDVCRIMEGHRKRWGAHTLVEITPAVIQEWVTQRASTVTPSTMVNEISPLRKAFKLAVKQWQYLKEDPTRDISFRAASARTPKYLSDAEVQILLELAQTHDAKRLMPAQFCKSAPVLQQTANELRTNRYNHDGTFDAARIRFLLMTALRRSQFYDLKWDQYDAKRGTLTLQSSDEHSEKGRRVNVIPLPSAAIAILEGQPRNSDYIFPNLLGECDSEMTRRLGRIFAAFEKRTGRHIHLHLLRHTALTQLLKHSKNIAAVSKYAGHADIKTTQIYAHILDDQLKEITKDFNPSVQSVAAPVPVLASPHEKITKPEKPVKPRQPRKAKQCDELTFG